MEDSNKPAKPEAHASTPTPRAAPPARRDEALVERFFRRIFDSMGAAVDRRFGREINFEQGGATNLTTSALIERMKRAIDERIHNDPRRGRIAPHLLKLKIEWGTHSEAPAEAIKEIENEVLLAAIDHINDNRYRTLAPVRVEASTDIFTTGINVEPSFGEFASEVEEAQSPQDDSPKIRKETAPSEIKVEARLVIGTTKRSASLSFSPGGRRYNVGRATDNDLQIDHPSVSKIHAVIRMNTDGALMIADTGSTNGTFVNGRRLAYGEARLIEPGDTLAFGDVEARFTKL